MYELCAVTMPSGTGGLTSSYSKYICLHHSTDTRVSSCTVFALDGSQAASSHPVANATFTSVNVTLRLWEEKSCSSSILRPNIDLKIGFSGVNNGHV